MGVGVGVGVGVGCGVGVAVDVCFGLGVDGAPPPTAPLPRTRAVAFEDAGGVSEAAATPHAESNRTPRTPQPTITALVEVERNNGSRARIFQAFAATNATSKMAKPNTVGPRLAFASASQKTKRT